VFKRLVLIGSLIGSFLPVFLPHASAATYTGCSSWRIVSNPWTGSPIISGSNQRYGNFNSMDFSCVDLNGVDFYGAVIGGVNWSKANLTNTNFGGTGYCGGVFTGADISGSNIKSTSTWTCAAKNDVYQPIETTVTSSVPVTASTSTTTSTTTTLPVSTTTTPVAPNYYCLKIGGLGLTVRWLNSANLDWVDDKYAETPGPWTTSLTLAEWQSKTNKQKIDLAMSEVALRPIPEGGCSSLDEQLVALSTPTTTTSIATTIPPTKPGTVPTVSATSPPATSNVKSVTTTTLRSNSNSTLITSSTIATRKCAPTADSLFIYSYFHTGHVTNLGGRFDSTSIGSNFDYLRNCSVSAITKILLETSYGTQTLASKNVAINFSKIESNCWRVARVSDYGQSEWSNRVCYTAPIKGILKKKNKTVTKAPRGVTGAQCLDGFRTKLKTKNACDGHFGRDYWLYRPFRSGYSFSYKPKRAYSRFAVDTGSATGRCVGICYGVPSKVNGLPRNTYVSGYFRKDGTYVGPYTRSRP